GPDSTVERAGNREGEANPHAAVRRSSLELGRIPRWNEYRDAAVSRLDIEAAAFPTSARQRHGDATILRPSVDVPAGIGYRDPSVDCFHLGCPVKPIERQPAVMRVQRQSCVAWNLQLKTGSPVAISRRATRPHVAVVRAEPNTLYDVPR